MAKFKEKTKVINLRKSGKSIRDISNKLNISKSTISLWCKDIKLTESQINSLYVNGLKKNLKGRLIGAMKNKQDRINRVLKMEDEARKMLGNFSQRDLMIAGISLYWAEGSKTHKRVIFVNSDPLMVKMMKYFLLKVLKVDIKNIRITIQINIIHKPRINKILKFWSDYLKIPLHQFSKPYYIKIIPKKVYENHDNYYGIVRMQVLQGTNLSYKILGLIKNISNKMPT